MNKVFNAIKKFFTDYEDEYEYEDEFDFADHCTDITVSMDPRDIQGKASVIANEITDDEDEQAILINCLINKCNDISDEEEVATIIISKEGQTVEDAWPYLIDCIWYATGAPVSD